MPTLADLKLEIAREIDAEDGIYTDDIDAAVNASMRYYQKERFWFSEKVNETFAMVGGQEFYGVADNANIPNIYNIYGLWMRDSGGRRFPLEKWNDDQISNNQDAFISYPIAYSQSGGQIRFYPIPRDGAYTAVFDAWVKFPQPDDNDDASPWTNEAYDLIKARSCWILAKDKLRDDARAQLAQGQEAQELQRLREVDSAIVGTGEIIPTQF